MGIKRKASFDGSAWPPSSPASSLLASTAASTPSTAASSVDQPFDLWKASPFHLSSRTRKRYRDGRPDEETIHRNTLDKLFEAQKHVSAESTQVPYTTESVQPETRNATVNGHDTNQPECPKERNQSSLDAFLGIRKPWAVNAAWPPKQQIEAPSHFKQQPLFPQYPVTQDFHSCLQSSFTCEDCSAALVTPIAGCLTDVDIMEVEGTHHSDADFARPWECSACAKHVCNTCAMQADQRFCLECALPGREEYDSSQWHEKRWVEGIGWV